MKINQKILTIVLGSVAAVGIIAGGTMFGVGGNQTQTVQIGQNTKTTFGAGWLNFESGKFPGPNGLVNDFGAFLELANKTTQELPKLIKAWEDQLADLSTQNKDQLTLQITAAKESLQQANDTITMHGVAIAGVTIMSIGLAIGVFAAGMEIFKFVTKKDKVTVNK